MSPNEEYWKFGESERHFNEIQAGIRNRAASWNLAAFGAIAVLIKVTETETWLVPGSVLISVVSIMATLGLLILWINDQLVYQRLLGSVFLIGLKREFDNDKLPPMRAMMMYSAEGKGMSRWMAFYYTIPMTCFFAISLCVLFFRERLGGKSVALDSQWSFWVLTIICVMQGVLAVWIHLKKSKVGSRERAKLFGNDAFTAMFDGTPEALAKLGNIVQNYSQASEKAKSINTNGKNVFE
jgi:hypothetical protein